MRVWSVVREAYSRVYGETTYELEVFSRRKYTSLFPRVRHLIDPNGVTLAGINRGIIEQDTDYLRVVIEYGDRGRRILRDPRNARKIRVALATSCDTELTELVTAAMGA